MKCVYGNFGGLVSILGLFFLYMGAMMCNFSGVVFVEWMLVELKHVEFEMVIMLDWISLIFSGVVMFISSMIVFYSIWYMGGDLNVGRFLFLLLLFVTSMLLVIMSPNLVSILLGWDGLGLVSYCLIIYYGNWSSYVAGFITIMFNRIGDIGLLLSIAWVLSLGDWNLYMYMMEVEWEGLVVLCIMMSLAVFTKSAQVPFSSWLPIAMAAPTPISSLVHSSTLVTAGVYLMIRYLGVFEGAMNIILVFGAFTMFFSGLIANLEYDLKKIIALSTLSQLGLMMMILSFFFKI